MKALKIGFALAAAMLASVGVAHAQQVLKVGRTPPVPGQVLLTTPVMEAVAKDMGVKVEWVDVLFGDAMQAVADKKIDISASIHLKTPDREKLADFSDTYASFRDALFLPTSDTKSYTSLADLKGMTVAVTRGTVFIDPLTQAGAKLVLEDSNNALLDDLDSGKAAASMNAGPAMRAVLAVQPRAKIRQVATLPPIAAGGVSFQVAKGNSELLGRINRSLAKLKADGTIKPLVTAAFYDYP